MKEVLLYRGESDRDGRKYWYEVWRSLCHVQFFQLPFDIKQRIGREGDAFEWWSFMHTSTLHCIGPGVEVVVLISGDYDTIECYLATRVDFDRLTITGEPFVVIDSLLDETKRVGIDPEVYVTGYLTHLRCQDVHFEVIEW